jgi:hypothetical protein
MPAADRHRFPLPSERNPFEPFPDAVPWDMPISELSKWWLHLQCGRCEHTTYIPLRLLAAQRGWFVTLRQIVPRLRCSRLGCDHAPPTLCRLDQDASGVNGRAGFVPKSLDLLAGVDQDTQGRR